MMRLAFLRRNGALFFLLFCFALRSAAQAPFQLPPAADAEEALRLAFYDYDRDLPLNSAVKPLDENEKRARFRVDYDSVHDQRVPAIFAQPKKFSGPYPVVILVHGSGGNKDTSYIQWVSEALTAQGFATFSIDTQYHGDRVRPGRSGEIHMPDSYTMRDAWMQSVMDLRRAVDYLESRPDVIKGKIGYMGFSQGAMLGGVVAGVEARISAFCLAVPGAGLMDIVQHIDQYPLLLEHWPVKKTPETMRKIAAVANVSDPIHFVGRIGSRALLIIVAKHDEIIPPSASKAFVEAAHAREDQVKRWDSGHVLHPASLFDVRNFFVTTFGKREEARN